MECWSFAFTVLGALASCASVIVAIVIYQRISDKDVLSHRRNIRRIIKDLKTEMDSGKRNYMLRIIDIDRFDKYYPEVCLPSSILSNGNINNEQAFNHRDKILENC